MTRLDRARYGWICLGLAGSGWVWLGLAGSGWVWLGLAGSGWVWVGRGWIPLLLVTIFVGVFVGVSIKTERPYDSLRQN